MIVLNTVTKQKFSRKRTLNKTGKDIQFQMLVLFPVPLFCVERDALLLKVAGAGCSVGLQKGHCSCNLSTSCALRLSDVLTGVLTLGFDITAASQLEPGGQGLHSTCLVKHLWLL